MLHHCPVHFRPVKMLGPGGKKAGGNRIARIGRAKFLVRESPGSAGRAAFYAKIGRMRDCRYDMYSIMR